MARYGYSVGWTTSPGVWSLPIFGFPRLLLFIGGGGALLPNFGVELRSPAGANPAIGDDVSKPPSCADVYICGGTFEEMEVSGRPLP